MKTIVFLFFTLFCGSFSFAQKTDRQAVTDVMHYQQTAWNRGDIESFMDGYWKSDSLEFVGAKTITYGWQNTLDNYKKGYPDKEAMGTLQFSELQIQQLSRDCCFVIGAWQLTRTSGNDVGGHFTLLFKKINNRWVIVVDHTS